MQILTTKQLIIKLKDVEPEGLEVSTQMGVLSTTKAVYKKKDLFFIFYMEYDFSFVEENGYSESEFLAEYSNWCFKVEQIIS